MVAVPPIPGLTAGAQLWQRAARVTVAGQVVGDSIGGDGHRISFSVTAHNRIDPNDGEITVFGLSQRNRDAISHAYDLAREAAIRGGGNGSVGDVTLEVGHDGVLSQVFKADITEIRHRRERPGWSTTITARDGLLPFANGIVNETIMPGVDINLAMTVIATSMRIAFLDVDSEGAFRDALTQFVARQNQGGLVLQGPTRDVLVELLESMRVAWTFEGGRLVLTRFDKTKTDFAVLLSPQTGLKLNGIEHRSLGRMSVTAVLNPKLLPGRQVAVTDELGLPIGSERHRIDKSQINGDTRGDEWDVVCDLRPTQAVG